MAEKLKTLTYDMDGQEVTITVTRTTAVMDSKRMRLINEGVEAKDDDPDVHNLRMYQYPNCMCCTTAVTGLPWPLSFEDFANLDGGLESAWFNAAVKLNPHWYAQTEAGEQAAEKKPASKPI